MAIGPGLGRDDDRRRLVRRLLVETELPAVVDADALFELEPFEREAPTVLTPHSGELAGLLGVEPSWVDAHRLEAAARAVERFGCVCLLKGADTIVAAPGEGVLVCGSGPPSLATAGHGGRPDRDDRGVPGEGHGRAPAAAAGATACAEAARLGPERGLVASDVVAALPDALDVRCALRWRSTSAPFAGTRRRLLEALEGAELWAVVKADAYGHGAAEVAGAALEAGAAALCVSTVGEGARAALGTAAGPHPRHGPVRRGRPRARPPRPASSSPSPSRRSRMDVPVHLKLDTGMGRFGMVECPRRRRTPSG